MEDDVIDYSKIDFKKFENRAWRDIELYATVAGYDNKIVRVVPFESSQAVARKKPEGWEYTVSNATTADIDLLRVICGDVDTFIIAELARIEAEEEVKNWVKVHWRDVEWLDEQGVVILHSRPGELSRLRFVGKPLDSNGLDYHADQRTFPTGYDPEKPRWVSISAIDDLDRLRAAGVTVRVNEEFIGFRCEADVHTLPAGVPLHVEPNRFVPVDGCDVEYLLTLGATIEAEIGSSGKRQRVDAMVRSVSVKYFVDTSTLPSGVGITPGEPTPSQVNVEPTKPEPRPCSKEFALSNPAFSEFRFRGCNREYWSEWMFIVKGGMVAIFIISTNSAPRPRATELP